jgi:hypothetical protein
MFFILLSLYKKKCSAMHDLFLLKVVLHDLCFSLLFLLLIFQIIIKRVLESDFSQIYWTKIMIIIINLTRRWMYCQNVVMGIIVIFLKSLFNVIIAADLPFHQQFEWQLPLKKRKGMLGLYTKLNPFTCK